MKTKRYAVLACAVLARECYKCAANSRNNIDVIIIDQGLHDIGEEKMSTALQNKINEIDYKIYDAILLVYGLCNNGIRGLSSKIPMVIPRAHDCITLLMGSKDEYMKYFNENPGTFYSSVGWVERANNNLLNPESTTKQIGMGTYEDYVKQYGEENAAYLMETLGNHLRNYKNITYIDTDLENTESQKNESKEWSQKEGLEYKEIKGSTKLISKLMDGDWSNAEFLLLKPGESVATSYDDSIIKIKD